MNKFSKIGLLYTSVMNSIRIQSNHFEKGLYSYKIDYDEKKMYPMKCLSIFVKEKSETLKFVNNNTLSEEDLNNNKDKNKYESVHFSLSYVDLNERDTIIYDMLLALLKSTVYRIICDKVEYHGFIQ